MTSGPRRFWPPAAAPCVRAHTSGLFRAVEEEAEAALAGIAGDVALDLTVALPEGDSLTHGRELDNYLLPVVSRLGQRRIPAVFARKVHGDTSTMRVEAARLRLQDQPPMMLVCTSAEPETVEWREQLRDACEAAVDRPAPPGPLSLDLAFMVSSLRNWTTLWKPALDALGPLLGVPDPDRPWSPLDDRVVRLGLHRTDGAVGHGAVVAVWWRPYSSSEAL